MFKFERGYGGFLALLWIVHIFVITSRRTLCLPSAPRWQNNWCAASETDGGVIKTPEATRHSLRTVRVRPALALPLNEQLFRLPVRLAMNE